MTRRSLIRLLLSLLLLISQQMAMSHAIAHWSGAQGSPASVWQDATGNDGALSKAFAEDLRCGQCVAFAQFASVLGNTARTFAAGQASSCPVAAGAPHPLCRRAEWVFQPRAPPAVS